MNVGGLPVHLSGDLLAEDAEGHVTASGLSVAVPTLPQYGGSQSKISYLVVGLPQNKLGSRDKRLPIS